MIVKKSKNIFLSVSFIIFILDRLSHNDYIVNMKENNNYNCPICSEFTSYDEWAKPQIACINCGAEE